MKQLKRADSRVQVEYILGSLVNAFGGPQGFVLEALKSFNASPPGRRADFLLAIMQSVKVCQPVEVDPDSLTDDELDEEFAKQVSELLEAQPEIAIDVLMSQGYCVSPPAHAAQ